jgi:hypothetical protein
MESLRVLRILSPECGHAIDDICPFQRLPWRSFISVIFGRYRPLTADPGVSWRSSTNHQALISSWTFGRKLYESEVHEGFRRNEIDFGKVVNSSSSGLCGNLSRPGPCHQSILSESPRRSEPKESVGSRDGIASGSDVSNSRNQTTGRNPGKGPDSRASGRQSDPIRLNQRCSRLLACPSHELLSS